MAGIPRASSCAMSSAWTMSPALLSAFLSRAWRPPTRSSVLKSSGWRIVDPSVSHGRPSELSSVPPRAGRLGPRLAPRVHGVDPEHGAIQPGTVAYGPEGVSLGGGLQRHRDDRLQPYPACDSREPTTPERLCRAPLRRSDDLHR